MWVTNTARRVSAGFDQFDSVHACEACAPRRLGALGVLSKSAEAEELVAAVRHAARGEPYSDPDTAAAIALAPTLSGETVGNLSNHELEILRLLADGKSLTGVAETLGIACKTVANQCTRIKEKLGLDRTADLIRLALEKRGSYGGNLPEP